tara:strand:+ start:2786 stop:3067 length:282 start_codon:yes stop_codon:yes gene_type:complete
MNYQIDKINTILIAEDIEGLIASGAPDDEYADEAAQLAACLEAPEYGTTSEADILALLSLIWVRSFELGEEEMALRIPHLETAARLIHSALNS